MPSKNRDYDARGDYAEGGSFYNWITGMEEEEYSDWIEFDASDDQEEQALNIRQPIDDDEREEIESEQEFTPPTRQEQIKQDVERVTGRKGSGVIDFLKRLFKR